MGLKRKSSVITTLLVVFLVAVASLAGNIGVSFDHGDRPNLGGGYDKFWKFKSNAKEIGADKIQVTSKNGSNSETDEELLP